MHDPRGPRNAERLAQEGGLLGVALDQMDHGARRLRQYASQHHAGKAAAAAEISPDFCARSESQELERIGNMPRPQVWKRRGCDQICLRLPLQKEADIAIQPLLCFT